ncbi:MAG: hypothetical protein ACPHV3_09060, partial [Vibrio sp.]
MFKKFIIFCFLIALCLGGGFLLVKKQLATFLAQPIQVTEAEYFQVESGMNLPKLVQNLSDSGKINHSPWVPLLRILEPELTKIKVGTFEIVPQMPLRDFLERVTRGVEHQ